MNNKNVTIIDHESTEVSTEILEPVNADKELEEDLGYVRDNMKDLIDTGIEGAKQLADIADRGQDDKSYERLAILLKAVSDMNKDFVDVAHKRRDLKKPKQQETTNNQGITQNNVFVGSTAEMLELLKKNGNQQ